MTPTKALLPLFTASVLAAPAVYAQKAGDPVTPDALGKLEWIQGEAPASWELGKLYVLECWATWCGPCLAAIPHLNALHHKYEDRGLRVIGVNVWEEGKDKVADFVKNKREGMSFPVGYTGRGGAFETDWLKPARVQGIPHTFLVKNGKVLAGIHPLKLTDELVEILLEDGAGAQTLLDALNAEQMKGVMESAARMEYSEASEKGDVVGMLAAIESLRVIDPKNLYIPLMENEVCVIQGHWADLETRIAAIPKSSIGQLQLITLAAKLSTVEKVPAEIDVMMTYAYDVLAIDDPYGAVEFARYSWQAGGKKKAMEEAKVAWEAAKASSKIHPQPFEKFVAALEAGSMPTKDEFMGWVRESQRVAPDAVPEGDSVPALPLRPITPET